MPGSRRLSQHISEGDGIAVIVCVDDAGGARDAEAQGAKAIAVRTSIDGIRDATSLPLLWLGGGEPHEADAVAIRPEEDHEHHHLESVVDVHAFDPAELEALMRGAGLASSRVRGEELLANWFGWFNRTLEASANHDDIPMPWFQFAFRGYLALQKVDRALLEPRLPPQVFYNLMIAARKP